MEPKIEFLNRMRKLLSSKEYDEFFLALKQPFKKGLVLNREKVNDLRVLAELNLKPLPYGDDCYLVDKDNLGKEILYRAGAFYLQEPSAMIPGIVLPLSDDDLVLDVCASPGGKSFQLARRLNGTLLSNEIDYARAKVLLSNIERLGLKNVIVSNYSSEELARNYPNTFDCVLIDAPCSGEGMFRKEPFAIEQWSEEYVLKCASMQEEIIYNADKTLKNGGYLVYSTCTFSLEENECNIKKLLNMGYSLVDFGEIPGETVGVGFKECKRFYFHKAYGEGQFVALLKKNVGENVRRNKTRQVEKIGNSYKKLIAEFLEKYTSGMDNVLNNLIEKNDAIYYCPCVDLLSRDKGILSPGVKLGIVTKSRFEPCHNLFTSFGNNFLSKINLDKSRAEKYLKGETLNTEHANGWCALLYQGVVLGGGKIVNGVVKNHYPKGLRK